MRTKVQRLPTTPPPPKAAGRPFLAPINDRAPISPQIYERLRRAITTLAMLPSESLSEQDLAKQLGVSRTPVREAIIRLQDEGLIDVLPQRGSFVAPIRLRDVEEAQFIREALEVSVTRRLAANPSEEFLEGVRANLRLQELAVKDDHHERFLELDEAFHRSFCEAAGLPKSWRVIQNVKLQMDRVRYLSLPREGQLKFILKQHTELFDAIAKKQPDRSAACMSAHLQEVLRTVRNLSAERPDLFGA